MQVIDAHVHVWPKDRTAFPPQEVAGLPFRELDGSAETLIALMDANGVDRAVMVQSPWYSHDDSYLLDCQTKYAGRMVGVACAELNLCEADIDGAARRLGRDGLSGVRMHLLGPGALERMQERCLAPVIARGEETGLPVLLIYRNHHMHPLIAELAGAHPGARLLIEHFAYAAPRTGATPQDVDALMRLSEQPNIFVKMAIHHQLSSQTYPWLDLHPLQRRLIDTFGADRLMWGSNFPMFMSEPSYAERLGVLRDHFPFKSDEEKAWILGGSAARLWPA